MIRARAILGATTAMYLAFLYAPVLLLPLFSFNASPIAAFPIRALTFDWYRALWSDPGIGGALIASLSAAVPAALIATAAGALVAYALVRRAGVAAGPVAGLSVAPLLIPGVVLGIALLIAARALGVSPGLPLVAAGQAVLAMPVSVIVMRAHFRATSRTVEDAALDLGATPAIMFWRIVLPIAAPALLSCLVMAFTAAMDEFVVSFFLVGTRQTLPLYIWDHLRFPSQLPRMMALGTLTLLISTALVLTAVRLSARELSDA